MCTNKNRGAQQKPGLKPPPPGVDRPILANFLLFIIYSGPLHSPGFKCNFLYGLSIHLKSYVCNWSFPGFKILCISFDNMQGISVFTVFIKPAWVYKFSLVCHHAVPSSPGTDVYSDKELIGFIVGGAVQVCGRP